MFALGYFPWGPIKLLLDFLNLLGIVISCLLDFIDVFSHCQEGFVHLVFGVFGGDLNGTQPMVETFI